MSQSPNEPNANAAGGNGPEGSPTASTNQPPASDEPRVTSPGTGADATRPLPRQNDQHPAGSGTPAAPRFGTSTDAPSSSAYSSAGGSNPYGHNPYSQHQSPQAPDRKPRKRFTGSTLIAGMVAAALIGGATAAGTTFLMDPDGNGAAQVQSPQSGIVINDPESATTATAAAAKAAPSVVTIEAAGNRTAGSGSGIILDKDGHILTNTHVVTLGGSTADPVLNVRLSNGKVYGATLVGTDPLSDLAVIKIDAPDLVPATLGDSSQLNVGDVAIAIGAPLGLSGTVTDGIISTLNRTISVASSAVPKQPTEGNGGDSQFEFQFPGMPQENQNNQRAESIYINVIQTDAAINHGNSGGALVDAAGQIIGVNVAIASSGNNPESGSIGVGFAIPIDYAKRISSELIANGTATHGLLGATVQAYSASSTSDQPSGFSTGARIVEVSPNSAAEKAGFRSGDVITGVNGRPIQDSQTLTAAIREVPANGTAKITYQRDNETKTVDVTVGSLE